VGSEFVADKTTKTPFFADFNFASRCEVQEARLLVYPMQAR